MMSQRPARYGPPTVTQHRKAEAAEAEQARIARGRAYGPPTQEIAMAQAEHDRMARNRQGRTPVVALKADEGPLAGQAFVEARLAQAVEDARNELARARASRTLGKTKADKKRLGRAVTTAAAALTAAEQALAAEKRDGPKAAQVQRQPVVSGSGVVLRDPRIVVATGGRAELQRALEWLLKRNAITRVQYQAARRYRVAWERAGRDAYPIGLGGDGGRSAPKSGNLRVEDAVGSSLDLSGARQAIGVFGSGMLEHIVVNDLTLDAWAEKQAVSAHVAKGVLVMVLERLGEHWAEVDKARDAQREPAA